jgi:hypothetical protein
MAFANYVQYSNILALLELNCREGKQQYKNSMVLRRGDTVQD